MRWTYDAAGGALYVYLNEGQQIEEQIELRANVIVDVDAEGAPVGIELLGPGTVCGSATDVEQFNNELEGNGLSPDEARMVIMLCFVNFPREDGLVMRQPGLEETQESAELDLQPA